MFARIKLAGIKIKWLSFATAVLLGVSLWLLIMRPAAYSQAVPGFCDAPYKVNWPTTNPVWSLCWTPPNQSTVNGSGLELSQVFYKGKRVFARAHLPVLNVTYDPGGCGNGPDRSFRDWQYELQAFEADNVLQPGYAEPTVPPKTVCDHPGTDAGTFAGVAVEKKADQLVLTTQMPAGWYRYTQKWIFRLDGTIQPRFGFSAIENYCTTKPHMHHAYWRFDFAIDKGGNDGIDEFNNNAWAARNSEFKRLKATSRKWRVMDRATRRGYQVIPGAQDGVADAFAVSDVWGLRYRDSEIDDGGAINGSDRAQMNRYINAESLNRQDVVLWYRVGYRHAGGIGCEFLGPTLKPVGTW